MPPYDVQHVTGVPEGQVLAGKYRVDQVLGVGGMGVVVAAHHVQLDERVALKFLLPEMLLREDAVSRFVREARAAVKIKSEHVARIYDVGTLDNGVPYMVMELLEGGDLADWLAQRGPLPVEQAVEFVLQACVAVAEAHQLGIVHRDLKPANLFCVQRPDGQLAIKVLDFGISKMARVGASVSGSTEPWALMGSPSYMAPEQIQSPKDVDARADLWAIGVILYELLSGRLPFLGNTLLEVANNITTQAPPSLRHLRQKVPAELEAIILHCLKKDPRARFDNVAALAVALSAFGPSRARTYVDRISGTLEARQPSSAPERPPSRRSPGSLPPRGQSPGDLPTPESIGPIGQTLDRTFRAKKGAILAGLAAAAAIALGAAVLRSGPSPTIRPDLESGAPAAASVPEVAASVSTAIEIPPPTFDADAALPAVAAVPSRPPKHSKPNPLRRTGLPTIASSSNPNANTNNCRLISSFDADGNQHFKQECGGN